MGDMATIGEEGYVEVVEWKKDMIFKGGDNIFNHYIGRGNM